MKHDENILQVNDRILRFMLFDQEEKLQPKGFSMPRFYIMRL